MASPTVAGIPIPFSETIIMFVVTLDQNLTLNNHVSSLSRSIHFYTRVLHHIRRALTEPMAATLGASLVPSRLDCVNSIMYEMSASNMHKLQSVQNSLIRVVLPSLRHLSPSEWLSYLHWLPASYWIQFSKSKSILTGTSRRQVSRQYSIISAWTPSSLRSFLHLAIILLR